MPMTMVSYECTTNYKNTDMSVINVPLDGYLYIVYIVQFCDDILSVSSL